MFETMVVHEDVFTCLDLVPQRTNAAADSFLFYERVRATVVASLGKQGHYVHWKQESLIADEQLTVSHEDTILLLVLSLLHPDLPAFIRDLYKERVLRGKRVLDFRTEILRDANRFVAQSFDVEKEDTEATDRKESSEVKEEDNDMIVEIKVELDPKSQLEDEEENPVQNNTEKSEEQRIKLDPLEETGEKLEPMEQDTGDLQEHEDASKGEQFDLYEENSTEGTELNHEYNFPCDQCEFIAPESRDLKRHKRHRHQTKKVLSQRPPKKNSSNKNRFSCTQCDYVTAKRLFFKRHIKSHPNMDDCQLEEYGITRHKLASNKSHKLASNKRFPCNKCLFTASSAYILIKHKKTEHVNEYPCDLCDFVATSEELLEEHKMGASKEHETVSRAKLACDQCEFTTVKDYLLNGHIEAVHNAVQFICDQCNLTFKSKHSLQNHIKVKHEGLKYYCDQCEYECSTAMSLTAHIRIKHDQEKLSCDECEYTCSHYGTLKKHIKSVHDGNVKKCPHCDYTTINLDTLNHHVGANHEGVKYSCDQCGFKSPKEWKLREHIKVQHEGVKYTCDQCTLTFSTAENKRNHVRLKHEGFKLSCAFCDYTTPIKNSLKRHYSQVHPDEKAPLDGFQCDKCEFSTDTLKSLRCHISKMHMTGSFSCSLCEFVAAGKPELANHKREAHNRESHVVLPDQRYKCKLCNFVANQSQRVTHHMASVHKQGAFLCSKCDFVGAFASELKNHEAKHGSFACSKCDFVAMFKAELTKHEKYKHGDKHVHPCPQCDYAATRADALKTHVEIVHLKIRYPCDQCACDKATKSDLLKHKRQKHGFT